MADAILPRTVLFYKNSVQRIELSYEPYRGAMKVDIREYADYDASGEFRPTKKGVSFVADREHVAELIDQLCRIQNELDVRDAAAA